MYVQKKPRIFFDMDGTLAEWRNITFSADIKRPEDIEEAVKKLNEILLTPGYFRSLLPYENVVEAVKILIGGGFNVHIASCAMNHEDKNGPAGEKLDWISSYIPELPRENIHIIPNGADKAKFLGISEGDVLVDDYTKNLSEWERSGGVSVKLLNDVNEKKGTWSGRAVSYSTAPEKIATGIESAARGEFVRHNSPVKNRDSYMEISLSNNKKAFSVREALKQFVAQEYARYEKETPEDYRFSFGDKAIYRALFGKDLGDLIEKAVYDMNPDNVPPVHLPPDTEEDYFLVFDEIAKNTEKADCIENSDYLHRVCVEVRNIFAEALGKEKMLLDDEKDKEDR